MRRGSIWGAVGSFSDYDDTYEFTIYLEEQPTPPQPPQPPQPEPQDGKSRLSMIGAILGVVGIASALFVGLKGKRG